MLRSSIWALSLIATSTVLGDDRVDYERDVKPVLKERCYACHGALMQEAELRLDTAALAVSGGDSGDAIVPGDVNGSLLWKRISAEDESERMPPEGPPLSPEQLSAVSTWIEQGAEGLADELPEADPRDHWAFRVPKRPPVPDVANSDWSQTPIDAFIAAGRAQQGLTTTPAAPREVLLRRLYLDLIGLPPTREQLHEFLADDSEQAYEREVEELLNSAQYGERWGRHWMDVWRYSDWYGRRMVPDVWNSAPQVWRWRDWIVDSLNNDKGYDAMIREMLAADEVAPGDDEAVAATAYVARNWFALNANEWMRDNVEYTTKSFLGLTFNCAHCHDHKYDPISQENYFGLRAFFEPIGMRQDRASGEAEPGPFQEYEYSVLRKIQRLGIVRVFDKTPDAPTWFYSGGDERNRDTERGSVAPHVPVAIGDQNVRIEPVELPPEAYYPGLRPAIQEQETNDHLAAVTRAEAEAEARRQAVESALPPLREALAVARADYDAAVADSGPASVLEGRQSLLLDSSSGRRILNNNLPGLTTLDEGATLSFRLIIVRDEHVNLQLAKHVVDGLTAGIVAFEHGRILSYQPGAFNLFEAGVYDFDAGQNRFEVSLVLEPSTDRCLLSVTCLNDEAVLVDAVPVALNGWNPLVNESQAITFDVRTGSVAAVDSVTWSATDGVDPEIQIDFEAEEYQDGNDVVGIGGWSASSYCVAPATSLVSQTIGVTVPADVAQSLQITRNAVAAQELAVEAAEANVDAARMQLASIEARIHADRVTYGVVEGVNIEAAVRAAVEAERTAAVATAEATLVAKRQALALVQALPADDGERAQKIETAQSELNAAGTSVQQARAALSTIEDDATYAPLSPIHPSTSSGRRRALAEWITSPTNPLTARVAVNHIWMRHFHSPLVSTVYDFGLNGAAPTHPELLDWLAVEFMESGWSMKHLHRLIVNSAVYRQGTATQSRLADIGNQLVTDNSRIDADNRFLWRMNGGRMEAEVVRDSLLWCAGNLDLTLGGQELENSEALQTNRRSLYYSYHPEAGGKSELGMLFDAADATDCYRRTRSVVPQQALALTNSGFVHAQSAHLVARLTEMLSPGQQPDSDSFITAAFEVILSRGPSEEESTMCHEFLARQQEQLASDAKPDASALARESLLRVLFNHNDFVAIR